VVVFDSQGQYITQFGSTGVELGQMDEPVGIASSTNGNIYIAEAWNQRIQVFTELTGQQEFVSQKSWDVDGWYGQSMENKPFIAADNQGAVFVTDPEGYRVIQFDPDGNFIRAWGDYSTDQSGFGLPSGIAVDNNGHVYVSDSGNNRILRFGIP
jgi:DNA-binding beta-propeller fold protein YncE